MRQFWNKTKIICTIGPACAKREVLREMILAGMDVARFNFSHGLPAQHILSINLLKALARDLKSQVAILQDLPGPKIRMGALKEDFIELKKGQKFYLTSKKIIGTGEGVFVNNPLFVKELKKNDCIYLNDGLVKLNVLKKKEERVICEVMVAGRIYPNKGVSSTSFFYKMGAVTPGDFKLIDIGIKAGVDFVAVSFVQSAQDILHVKNYLKKKNKRILVMAKIERKVAFENIDEIIKVSDAIMVARGDLGIQANLEEVPFLQKELIKKCNNFGRPVVTATQMLESMVNNPQPTRAEVSDIANAIIDGSDALMLSEETAIGKFPVSALKMMAKIANQTEKNLKFFLKPQILTPDEENNFVKAFSQAAVSISESAKAEVIVIPTEEANSIFWVSQLRPHCTIVGLTTKQEVFKKLILFWGVFPILIKKFHAGKKLFDQCAQLTRNFNLARKNNNVVILKIGGTFAGAPGILELRRII